MAFLRVLTFVLVSFFGLSYCAYVDTLTKCSVKDTTCQKNLIQKIMKDIAESGIPEIDMPSIDPLLLKNLNISILDAVEFFLEEGTVKGVKDCIVDNTDVNLEHRHVSIQLTCDITIKGKYILKSTSPVLKNILGGDIHGEGIAKAKLEKMTIKMDWPYEIVKRGDDIFFTSERKNYKYTYDINGKVTFAANNLYLGDKESSKDIITLMNENWKSILADKSANKVFDIAIDVVYKFIIKFFTMVSASKYLTDVETLA